MVGDTVSVCRMKRWRGIDKMQPILTAKTVIPIVFSISILFIPIGIVLLHTSQSVQEYVISYANDTNNHCIFPRSDGLCEVNFTLAESFEGDVYFYYGLENYFQNHRRYMKSRNDEQLLGNNLKDCTPFERNDAGQPIAPCGAIANSLFNDTFRLEFGNEKVAWTHEGLVWPVDLASKFKNPLCGGQQCNSIAALCDAFLAEGTVRPPNWQRDPCKLDNNTVQNSGFQNADFIIWMRTAALPDFRKPYRKLDRENNLNKYANGLPAGDYKLVVENNYNVSEFGGKKSFIISTTSWMGGKNPFLGIAYISVGVLCACLGVVFIFVHLKYGHTLEEIAGLEQFNRRAQ
uniref:Cell cycle control protein 50A n=1 Tax=Globodera pallida TaxID=36090 RepID=A0A183C3I8_GLOPA